MSDRVPNQAPGRPTVPETAEALRAYYALPLRSMGGSVHIITEDGNVKQSHADWCAAHAREWSAFMELHDPGLGLLHADDDERIARTLAAMTPTQRWKLYRMQFYPWVVTNG